MSGLKNLMPGKLGFGTAPLGNKFRSIPEAEAQITGASPSG